jgi:DNA-binding transcriptional MocR family regulator
MIVRLTFPPSLSQSPLRYYFTLDVAIILIAAPGMRIGWIAGPQDFIAKYQLYQEMTTQFPSGVSQSIFAGLVSHWSEEGLDHHVKLTQAHYKRQRDYMVSALKKYLTPSQVAYNVPTGGMFIWLKFLGKNVPGSGQLFKDLAAAGVITVPGGDFSTLEPKGEDPSIVRLTFAAASQENIDEGIKRIASGLNNLK